MDRDAPRVVIVGAGFGGLWAARALAKEDVAIRLLDALWPLLKPGGRLVFTTCSLFRAEGQAQVDAFLQRTTTGIRRPCPGHLLGFAENPPSFEGAAGWSGDGFFHSRLDKAV